MSKNIHIASLNKLGQSIWYDNCSRDVLKSGELKRLIDAGVSGLTSNPTIFKKAIADSKDYDSEIKELSRTERSTESICEELMIQDVGAAADLLMPVYKASAGKDGFASIEVSPLIASNSSETVEAARRLWATLNRQNVMIKIPATSQGIEAIEQVIAEGINVNVTLIFSVEVYKEVMKAYRNGLQNRLRAAQKVDHIHSVASFFVSRLDSLTEKRLEQLVAAGGVSAEQRKSFEGRVGIANSKLAYEQFEKFFNSPDFSDLKSAGANIQRPLWASTGTKNPAFSPVLYVEELAGQHTVNTLPPATLEALLNSATIEPRLHSGLNQAQQLLSNLEKLGVSLSDCLTQLLEEGVSSFAQSFEELLAAIDQKKGQLAA